MQHGTIRAATLKKIIQIIMEHLNCSENEALKKFYESHTGACFADDSTGLFLEESDVAKIPTKIPAYS